MAKIDPRVANRIREDIARTGTLHAAETHNRNVAAKAAPGQCGGCYGAGIGGRCSICGGVR